MSQAMSQSLKAMHAGYGIEQHRTEVLRRNPRTGSLNVALGLQTAELTWERSC